MVANFSQAGHGLVASSTRTRVYESILTLRGDRLLRTDPRTAATLGAHRGPGVGVLLAFGYVHCRIINQTRCLALDPGSRRAFAAYWALIRPTSGLLRRRWLKALRERARWTLTVSP